MTVVRQCHKFPREAADATSLEVLRARLDGALGNLGWWEVSLPMAGGWDWVAFQPKPVCDSVIHLVNSTVHRYT